MTTTADKPAIAVPAEPTVVDDAGRMTQSFYRFQEQMAYTLGKVNDAALAYTTLSSTASTTDIVTALNAFMAKIQNT